MLPSPNGYWTSLNWISKELNCLIYLLYPNCSQFSNKRVFPLKFSFKFNGSKSRWKDSLLGIHLLLLHAEAGGIWVKSIFLLLSLFLKILLLHDGIELHVVEQTDLPLGLHNHGSLASLHAKSSMAEPSLRLHIGPDGLRRTSKRQLPSLFRGRFCLFGWGSCKLHNLKKQSEIRTLIGFSLF